MFGKSVLGRRMTAFTAFHQDAVHRKESSFGYS
jgi:hypothetical protein